MLTRTRLAELQDTVASRQKLEGQKQENVGVQKVRPCRPCAEARLLTVTLGV